MSDVSKVTGTIKVVKTRFSGMIKNIQSTSQNIPKNDNDAVNTFSAMESNFTYIFNQRVTP